MFYNTLGESQSQLNTLFKKRDLFYEYLKRGHEPKSIKEVLIFLLSALYTALGYPYFIFRDVLDKKQKQPATIGLLFRKTH